MTGRFTFISSHKFVVQRRVIERERMENSLRKEEREK
jgi:hypothetical protein